MLAMWKKTILSPKGERVRFTPIWSTLINLLIYFMFLFNIPRKDKFKLERDFLWGRGTLDKKITFSEVVNYLHK